ncbi:ferredoxin [Actinomadura kijaniata]|uniref:Ferredoxin n=1 Tax=Actinomadura namibiensis TaxID=182080 RepID=A0A7W3LIU8_ACTNM|nr:ferredoxin [Actinomadura namibiensis]MBA8948864.1 ferredoxin [Actinomadura namibiensis]
MKVGVDTGACVGSGQCAFLAPEVFDQREEDGVVELLREEPPEDRRQAVLRAARSCPTHAIRVTGP